MDRSENHSKVPWDLFTDDRHNQCRERSEADHVACGWGKALESVLEKTAWQQIVTHKIVTDVSQIYPNFKFWLITSLCRFDQICMQCEFISVYWKLLSPVWAPYPLYVVSPVKWKWNRLSITNQYIIFGVHSKWDKVVWGSPKHMTQSVIGHGTVVYHQTL